MFARELERFDAVMTPIDVLTELPPPPDTPGRQPKAPPRPKPQSEELSLNTAHVIAVFIELALIVAFLSLYLVDDPWRWERDGERFVGVVIETQTWDDEGDDPVDWAIVRDPQTELTVGLDPPWDVAEGQYLEVVRSPRDHTEVKTPEAIWSEYVLWVGLGVAALVWPLLVWSVPLWVFGWRARSGAVDACLERPGASS
jgi:hypothetical protein